MGHVPLGAILRQVVVVQNIMEDSDMVFKWRIPNYWGSDGMRSRINLIVSHSGVSVIGSPSRERIKGLQDNILSKGFAKNL